MDFQSLFALLVFGNLASAHVVAWAKGMYCLGSPDDVNTDTPVGPLFNLPKSKWWFQADRGCDKQPPAPGDFLKLPAGGSFSVQMAHNRAFTTFSYNGSLTTPWPDAGQHPEDWSGPGNPPGCINNGAHGAGGAMHTNNQSMASGTVFAISYNSEISEVTMENLVVFTVLANSPWHRVATYDVPANLPRCPAKGCICAWGWVPKGCGQANVYMAGYKCKVTGTKSRWKLAPARAPTYCATRGVQCVRGAKQILIMYQKEGNNVVVPPNVYLAYDATWGFFPGAQNDIFL